jgi:uncharacterized protein YcbK (DUF882 family)
MDFWDNIKGFERKEFACKDGCGFDSVDVELLSVLMLMRSHFGKELGYETSIHINSPNRCVAHNEKIQKQYNPNYVAFSSKSTHMYGIAADIVVRGVHADLVADYLEGRYPNKYGIGRYSNPGRIHIDVRAAKARWGE